MYTIRHASVLGVKSVQFSLHQGKKVKLQHYFSFSFSISFYLACIMLGVKSVQFSFHQGRKVKLQHFYIEISSKNARVQSHGLSLNMWYVFYFKFPLKTFTQKTLQLSSEGIIVTRGNSYEKIVQSQCLSSLDSKILVIVWRPSWMAFYQMFKKTVYAFVWSPAVRTS